MGKPGHLKRASQLIDQAISRAEEANVGVVFSEMNFPDKFVDTIQEATGVRLYTFSHVTGGEYTDEKFEDDMKHNMESLTMAVINAYGPRKEKPDARDE